MVRVRRARLVLLSSSRARVRVSVRAVRRVRVPGRRRLLRLHRAHHRVERGELGRVHALDLERHRTTGRSKPRDGGCPLPKVRLSSQLRTRADAIATRRRSRARSSEDVRRFAARARLARRGLTRSRVRSRSSFSAREVPKFSGRDEKNEKKTIRREQARSDRVVVDEHAVFSYFKKENSPSHVLCGARCSTSP